MYLNERFFIKTFKKLLPDKFYRMINFASSFFLYIFLNYNKPVGSFLTFKFAILIVLRRRKPWYEKSLDLTIIADEGVFSTLVEVYNQGLYDGLKGLNLVLDLGAFIGESAAFLASRNNQVICFEPSVEKFELIEKNKKKNITTYNAALTTSEKKEIDFFSGGIFDAGSSTFDKEESGRLITKVNSIHIREVMEKYSFDGLKMDIEGGEFDILWFLLDEKKVLFPFKKGVIEFHFNHELEARIRIFNRFIEYLSNTGIEYQCFDNSGDFIDKKTLLAKLEIKEITFFNLEFYKL